MGSFHNITPLGSNSVIAFGLRGHVIRSDDAGVSWKQIDSGVQSLLTDALVLKDGRLVVAGVGGNVLISNQDLTKFNRIDMPDRRSLARVLQSNGSIIVLGEGGSLKIPFKDAEAL